MFKKFWMVMANKPDDVSARIQKVNFMPNFKHSSLASATTEAERLARLVPDVGFFVLESHSMARVNTVVWSKPQDDDSGMPF